MTDYVKLGAILKEARISSGYTQSFVAGLLGLTPANVSSWERGKSRIDIESYAQLCNLYNIDSIAPLAECSDGFCYPSFPVETEHPPISALSLNIETTETKESPSASDEDMKLLNKFHQLDVSDQGRILERIDILLESAKYSSQDALKNA